MPMTVSVLMPVRLPAPWLREAILSLVMQSRPADELVIVLHGASREAIEADLPSELPTKIVEVPESKSFSEVLNVGVSAASSELVARLDSDDRLHPRHIEIMEKYLRVNNNMAACAALSQAIDSYGRIIKSHRRRAIFTLRRQLLWKNTITHSGVVFRRRVVQSLGGYDPSAVGAEDYGLWLRLGNRMDRLPQCLVDLRIHEHQTSRQQSLARETVESIRYWRREYGRSNAFSRFEILAAQIVWEAAQTRRRWRRKASNSST